MGFRGWRAATSTDTATTIKITAACDQMAPADLWMRTSSGTTTIPSASTTRPSTTAVVGDANRRRLPTTSVVIAVCAASGCILPTERNATLEAFRERYGSTCAG